MMAADHADEEGAVNPAAHHVGSDDLVVENMVLAVLAVGGYPLEKVFALLDSLREHRLTDPEVVETLDEGEVFLRLLAAGYDRGPSVTNMMARRVMAVHAAVQDGTLARVAELLDLRQDDEGEKLAVQVPGIGPKVFQQFVMLHRSSATQSADGHQ